jgi:hypothetical protein
MRKWAVAPRAKNRAPFPNSGAAYGPPFEGGGASFAFTLQAKCDWSDRDLPYPFPRLPLRLRLEGLMFTIAA